LITEGATRVSTSEGIPAQSTPREPSSPVNGVSRVNEDGTPRDIVAVRLPATAAYLTVLRTTTASLAARLDFTLDEIEDLRIAVDEASCLLLAAVRPETELTAEFELGEDWISVTVSADTVDSRGPARDSFAWTVLSALAGEVDAWTDRDGRQSISLIKHREREASA
jgi:serine/threonine-protein kinase RsbW